MSYTSEVLTDAPGWYPRLGEASGSTVNDSSGNGRSGTYVAGGTLAQPSLIQTDADTSWLAPTSGAGSASVVYGSWMNAASISIEAWTKTTSSAAGVLVCRDTQVGTRVWQLQRNAAGKVVFTVIAGANPSATSSASINDGNAHHVVVTYDGTTCKIYIDNVLDTTATLSQALPQPTSIGITIGNSARTITSPAAATMDEVAYYPGTILTGARVTAHYAAATSTSGTFAAILPIVTASFTGTYRDVGTFAATLPAPLTAAFSGTYTAPPTGTFAATLPVVTADFAGDYTPPATPTGDFAAVLPILTADFSGDYHPHESGTFDATLPSPLTAALSGTYTPGLETGSFAAVLPILTASFTGEGGAEQGSFAAVLPILSARFSGSYGGPYPTDTSNTEDGLDIIALGIVTVTRPVVAPPASLVLAQKYDLAVAYPVPDMDNGRPT